MTNSIIDICCNAAMAYKYNTITLSYRIAMVDGISVRGGYYIGLLSRV